MTFNLSETSTVEIVTFGDVDTYVKLFDRLGNMIAEDDDSGGDYNAYIERLLQRGDAQAVSAIGVASFSGAAKAVAGVEALQLRERVRGHATRAVAHAVHLVVVDQDGNAVARQVDVALQDARPGPKRSWTPS